MTDVIQYWTDHLTSNAQGFLAQLRREASAGAALSLSPRQRQWLGALYLKADAKREQAAAPAAPAVSDGAVLDLAAERQRRQQS